MRTRRILPALFGLLVLLAAAATFAATRGGESEREREASACPAGYTSREDREAHEVLERLGKRLQASARAEGADAAREQEREREGAAEEGPNCVRRKTPEPQGELMTIQQQDAKRSTGGVTETLKPGAYRSAAAERRALAAQGTTLPGSAGTWKPAGTGPQIDDDPRFGEVNGQGLADINGRISDFAATPDGSRVFAAVGEGGVWESTDAGKSWRSIGESLPTQAVGSVGYSPAGGGTLVVTTGDSVFGGGATFAGAGVYRSVDDGASWQRSTITGGQSLDGVITFKVANDPTNDKVFYAATGAGLFRSADAGVSFTNVALPTGRTGGKKGGAPLSPDCTGAPLGKVGCFQANMVTDVVVQGAANDPTKANAAGAKPGSVVAVVGWRAGQKQSPPSAGFPDGYVESPNNGVYRSGDGTPGSFERADAPGFTPAPRVGRVELGLADGAAQDHNYLYAIVEDAVKFNGGTTPIDVSEETGAVPNTTVLDGVYVSKDFGASWTKMVDAEELKDPATGSALTGTACATLYCPGVQGWYNQWIKPDPTASTAAGVPTRVTFGLEEVWQNRLRTAQDGKSSFKVVGPYFSGSTCLFLNVAPPACPTTAGDPTTNGTTTHPDQHAGLYVPGPKPGDPVRLFVGNDGGAYQQQVAQGEDVNPDGWGRGANQGFNTLLPYDAQVAKDGTIYAGLQDNGELKIQPDGKQFGVFGGDGAFSAVDPDNADVAYESYTNNDISKTTDGGKTFTSTPPPADTYQFINPFTMDPLAAEHLITAGTSVHETTDGAANWTTVYDLGTRKQRGTSAASGGADDPDNSMSAIDVRSIPTTGTPAGTPAKATKDVPEYEGGAGTVPDPVNATADTGMFTPGTYDDKPFTIAPDEANASATVEVSFDNTVDDFDLYVLRKEGDQLVEVGRSATSEATEKVVLTAPPAGEYVVRVVNFAAVGTFKGKVTFKAAVGTQSSTASAAYVAFCGYCDALNVRPFDNGIATNVTPDGKVGEKGKATNWHIAKATGLPKRYVTSIQLDPTDPRTVYATIAGYSRRWLPVGVLGENPDVSKGNVFKSTDAGESFKDISGNLPDVPANWTLVRNGQLVVATNVGTFISADTSGGDYEVLGTGLPTAPVFTLELKPKASPSEPDVLIAATQGRGVYRYAFADPVKQPPTTGGGTPTGGDAPSGGGTPAGGGSAGSGTTGTGTSGTGTSGTSPSGTSPSGTSPSGAQAGASAGSAPSCTATSGFRSVGVKAAGRGVRLSFERRVANPVSVDVFRVSEGRDVLRERLVARFTGRAASFTWNGIATTGTTKARRLGDGVYFVRYRIGGAGKVADVRRLVLRRTRGRFAVRPDYYRRASCDLIETFKLERPVFGGRSNGALGISYRPAAAARVTVTVRRGTRVIRRFPATTASASRTARLRLAARGLPRGDYRVTLVAVGQGRRVTSTLVSRRL